MCFLAHIYSCINLTLTIDGMIRHNSQPIIEKPDTTDEEESDNQGEPLCMLPSSLLASTSTSQHANSKFQVPKRQHGELYNFK